MGAYFSFEIAGYQVLTSKGLPFSEFLTLFRQRDRLPPPKRKRRPDKRQLPTHAYQLPAGQLIERLEIMGFTLCAAKDEFSDGVQERLDELRGFLADKGFPSFRESLRREQRFLRGYTFTEWSIAVQGLRTRGLLSAWPNKEHKFTPIEQHILNTEEDDETFLYGFPCSDIRYLVRALLAGVDPKDDVLLDLTDLEDGGYLEPNDQPVTNALETALRLGRACEKILVLTEGRSDTTILSRSMNALYPHLADLYSFLDYEAFSLGGGSGNLMNLVKGLAGVGIGNRVLALFDNDTAGTLQAKEVTALNLPANFRILTLPPLTSAKRYLALGPHGLRRADLNGLACSIELYLGNAALTDHDGSLVPVQWRGYDVKAKRYQGELLDKASVQERYLRSLDHPDQLEENNLVGIRSVLQVLFTAFTE